MFIESQLKALGLVLAAALLVACSSAENISSGQVGSDDTNNSDTNNSDTNDSVNTAPTANAGADQQVDIGATVTLDASASGDSDGSIVSYHWRQTAGVAVSIADANSQITTFVVPESALDSNLSFELVVVDDDDTYANDSLIIVVSATDNNPDDSVPVADGGADQRVNEGATVTLDASASSASGGSIATYQWTQIDGAAVALNNATSAQATFEAPQVDSDVNLIFRLTVTNTNDALDTDNVVITILDNAAPTAQASAISQAYEGDSVELDGSASADSDGSIVAYLWTQTAGPTASIADADAERTTFIAPAVDGDTALTFQLTVTDNDGAQSTDTISITILDNAAPTAQASAAAQAYEGTTVELDGSASADSDGSIASYSWQQIDSSGYSVTLSNTAIAQPTFTAPAVAADTNLIFQLTVTDNDGAQGSATVTITILYNNPPTANAGANQSVNEGATVQLDASASSDLEDEASSLTYSWQQVDSSGYTITLSDANIANPIFTAPNPAANTDLIFQLTVTDSLGKSSDANATITVIYNNPPEANAGGNQSVNEGATVQLDASASSDLEDAASSLTYSWQQVDSSGYTITLSDATAATPSFTAPNPAANTDLIFQLTVTDSLGKSSDANATISVIYNNPPEANAGGNQSVNEGATVQLDASASSDLEDAASSLTYSWQQVDSSGYTITLSDATAATPSFTAPNPAANTDLIFQLTVTDSLGKSSDANVTITVLYNNPPEANAGANQSVNEGATVQLDGSDSSDLEDEASSLTYSWQQVDNSGYSITLSDATAATPSFTTPEVAADTDLIFQLTVTDSLGKSSDANATITVIYNNPPEANAGGNQSVNEGTTIQLDGSDSSDLEDEASSLTYSWQQVDSSGYSISLSDATAATPSFTTPEVAADTDLIFQLTATDSLGKSSDANVTITVIYNNPPEANAGGNQSVNEGTTVQLDGSDSSDLEDEASSLTYSWQQVDSSGYSITLSDPNTATPSFTTPNPVAATTDLTFNLKVTDSLGKSSEDSVIIRVTYNNPPEANAGANQSVNEGATVQLDGSASSDSETSSLAYSWQQVDSSGYTISLSDANTATPSFTAPNPVAADTDLIFQLTVTDSLGKSSDANVTITVLYNNPPTANAGNGAIVDENQFIELDGSGSSDPEGGSLDYLWQQVDDSGFTITLSDDEIAQPTFTTPYVETTTDLSFQLTVTDAGSKSSSDTISFRVLYNHPPNANAGGNQSVNEGASVQLSGSASSDLEDEDSSLTYSWQQVDSSGYTISLNDANTATPSFTAPNPVAADTDLIFQLTVTDSLGKTGQDTVTITVIYNNPPSANAGANAQVNEGDSVQLDASASSDLEDEASSLTYSWLQVDSSGYTITLSGATTTTPSFTAPEVAADTDLIFQLTVTDSLGKTGQDTVTITVLYNNPPSANAGANAQVNEGDSVELDGSASSDLEDSSLTYSWQQVDSSGHTISLSNPDTATPSFTAPNPVAADTNLIFQLTVTDSLGKSSDANVTITVIYNTPPNATAGANQSVDENQVVQLNGSGSSDPEGGSLDYLWQQVDDSGYTITLSDPAIASPTFTAPEVAADTALTFNLTVTDSLGKTDQDNVTITVIYNTPPNATAGANQSVNENQVVQLDGSASSDFEDQDSSLAYSWQQSDSSGYTIILSDANSATPSFTAPEVPADTDLTFQLTVTDSLGKSDQDTVTITVLHIPLLIVDAGINNSQAIGTIANLRGSVSGGAESIASYFWQETTSHGIAIERADSANASFVVPDSLSVGDVINFQLTVTDSDGASASATTSITIAEPGTLKWRYDIGRRVRSSPAIGPDGTVYFGANDDNLYALNSQDGSLKWSFATGDAIDTPPTLDADGTVYFGSNDNYLYAVSPPTDGSQSGVEKWRYDTGEVFDEHSSVAIAADGTLYFGSRNDHLYALDPEKGSVQWSYLAGGAIIAAPAISPEGNIYFGSDSEVYAIRPPSNGGTSGEYIWDYSTAGFTTWTSAAIGADGSIYNGSQGDYFYALNPEDGNLQWRYGASGDIRTSPAIAADGTVYFGSRDLYLYAFDPDNSSTYKWRYETGGNVDSSPAIGADGTVYFGSGDYNVYALDPDGKQLWFYDLGSSTLYSSAALAPDGTLFIGANDGLYAIHTASAGLMDSPWPKFGQNNRSTGRVNLAPTADAGSEQTVAPGATVNLDASASSDSDGAIIDYYWRETSGYGISILNNSSAQASFTAPTPSADDTLTIELTVTDDHDTPTTTTLNINIQL